MIGGVFMSTVKGKKQFGSVIMIKLKIMIK